MKLEVVTALAIAAAALSLPQPLSARQSAVPPAQEASQVVVFDRFRPVFISHLHSDHTLGLPAMLYYDRQGSEPFTVFGPPGLKNMMDHIIAAYGEDPRRPYKRLEHRNPVTWETNATEVCSSSTMQCRAASRT